MDLRLTSLVVLIALLPLGCGDSRDRGSSGTRPASTCGNGQLDGSEVCDGANLGGATCEGLGLGAGSLSCRRDCKALDRSLCAAPTTCGNGAVDPAEVCEGADLSGQSCASLGLGVGALSCLPNCNGYQTAGCMPATGPTCGDGRTEGTEVCDGADLGGATCQSLGFTGGSLSCAADCRARVTSACTGTCTPQCGGRTCGPDPVCGMSCGTCSSGTCSAAGQCEGGPGGAPRIISFSANTTQYTGGALIFSAIVTDPDGVDDLIGGQLSAPSGGTYGSFATAAQEGAYSLSLDRNALHQVDPLIGPPGGIDRRFIAQFFDQSGSSARQELTIHVACPGSSESLCGTECADLSADDFQCGVCGRSCASVVPADSEPDNLGGQGRWCAGGQCHFRVFSEGAVVNSCQALCAQSGASCATPAGSPANVGVAVYNPSCALAEAPIPSCGATPVPSGCSVDFLTCRCAL